MTNIIILGFYDRDNLGDEAYKIAFPLLLPQYSLTFACVDDITRSQMKNYDICIVGGGDVINEYFSAKLQVILLRFRGLIMCASVGTTYPTFITADTFKSYQHVFTRNFADVRPIQRIVGSAHFMPDAVFALTAPMRNNVVIEGIRPKCGVFLIQNLMNFEFVISALLELLIEVSQTYDLIFYAFNTNTNLEENDSGINNYLYYLIPNSTMDNTRYNAYQMMDKIAELDFAICARYHSHILSMLVGVPFMSISSSRKSRELMSQMVLSAIQYQIPLNSDASPISADSVSMISVFNNAIGDSTLSAKIVSATNNYKTLLSYHKIGRVIKAYLYSRSNSGLISHLTDFSQEFNNNDNLAKLVSRLTVGAPDTEYVYGIWEKLNNPDLNKLAVLNEAVNYLKSRPKLGKKRVGNKSIPISFDINEYYMYHQLHRGGWYIAIDGAANNATKGGLITDFYLDKTFHWNSDYYQYMGIIPYSAPWCGFIHHTLYDGTENNLTALFQKPLFLASLDTCRGLFTLTESLSAIVRQLLGNRPIQVHTMYHPVVKPTMKFSILTQRNLVQIGSWMRNSFSIYSLTCSFNKRILVGESMNDLLIGDTQIKPYSDFVDDNSAIYDFYDPLVIGGAPIIYPCRDNTGVPRIVKDIVRWLEVNYSPTKVVYKESDKAVYIEHLEYDAIKAKYDNAKISTTSIGKLSNAAYDKLMSSSIIFLDLFDSAAVNTVIECIVRNTPLIVNRTAGVVDALGANYPLYYDNGLQADIDAQIEGLLTPEKILEAHLYLKNISNAVYKLDYFISDLRTKISAISL